MNGQKTPRIDKNGVRVDMPEHHQVADVLLAVELAFGEVAATPVILDLVMDLRRSRLQYRASG